MISTHPLADRRLVLAVVGRAGLGCIAVAALIGTLGRLIESDHPNPGAPLFLAATGLGVVGLLTFAAYTLFGNAPAARVGTVLLAMGGVCLAGWYLAAARQPDDPSAVVVALVLVSALALLACAFLAGSAARSSPRDGTEPILRWPVALPLAVLALAIAWLGISATSSALDPLWVCIQYSFAVLGFSAPVLFAMAVPTTDALVGTALAALACLPAAVAAVLLALAEGRSVGRSWAVTVLLAVFALAQLWLAGALSAGAHGIVAEGR